MRQDLDDPFTGFFPTKDSEEPIMHKQTVLIVGIPSATSQAWVDAFHQRGFAVLAAGTTAEAVRIWREYAPMLTIVDSSIAAAESVRLCRDLRGLAHAPILVILPTAEYLADAYRAGATECLVHPSNPAVILLKALAWSMRSVQTEVHVSQKWEPEGGIFQNSLTSAIF